MTTASPTLKVNPVLGAPPTLEWRPLGDLHIDPTYQRSIQTAGSQKLIRRIAQNWDWAKCPPLAIGRRLEALKVIDGQHRMEGARLRGDIPHLPCIITNYATAAEEAAAFVALNQLRRPLSVLDLFKAGLVAGDPEATAIMAAITAAGLRLATSTNLEAIKPGSVSNIGGLQRCYRSGDTALKTALAALAKAWPGEVLRYAGTLFPGFAAVVSDELRLRTAAADIISPLADLAAAKSQGAWRQLVLAATAETGGGRASAELVFRQAWRSRHQAAPAPGAIAVGFAWCDQCDMRVTASKAAACTSPFCKVKAPAQ